jgi:hypothetical protein
MNVKYIIVDKAQEKNTFHRFEGYGAKWRTGEFLDEFVPSKNVEFEGFPYSLIIDTETFTAYYSYDVTFDLDAII